MGRFNIRKETYVDRDLDDKIDNAAERRDVSASHFIREAIRHELQRDIANEEHDNE